MFQLLVVDDEATVVDGIADTLPWEEIKIGHVHKAYSAYQALDVLERHSIDIVITDIRMPDMDGLQLIEKIRAAWKRTRCILLTGYAEFEYAKQALLTQTEDYLLKPVSDDDLLHAVHQVVLKLEKEWEEISSRQRAAQTLREYLPLLRGGLLHDLLQGRRLLEEQLSEKIAMLDIPVAIGDTTALLIVRPEEQFAQYDVQGLSLVEYALVNMAEEILSVKFDLWNCKDNHDFIVFLVKARVPADGTKNQECLELLASQLQTAVHSYLKGYISVVVGTWGQFPGDIAAIYREAVSALRKKIGNDRGLFLTAGDFRKPIQMTTLQTLYEPPLLIHLLEAGRWEEVAAKLARIFEELDASPIMSQEHILEVFYTVYAAFCHIAHVNGKTLSDLLPAQASLFAGGIGIRSIQQLREWAFDVLARIIEDNRSEIKGSRAAITQQVQEYIDSNLGEDVSLQAIADHVYLHPVYLSKLYKLETGEGLSEYLLRVRMERAAYLLKHSTLKIYEITAQVGYQNAPYFIKVFRKQFGITPQEYREGWIGASS